MADDRHERAWAVFDQLADVPADQREAVLRAACGDDLALRAEVERLLAVDDRLASRESRAGFLQSPLLRTPAPTKLAPGAEPPSQGKPRLPDRVGRYRVLRLLGEKRLTVATAESVTAGQVAAWICRHPGASDWFRGGIVAYDAQVKYDVLGVPAGPVVTESAAAAIAEGAARVTGADVGLGITGVAGPDEQEGVTAGTVLVGLFLPGQPTFTRALRVPGDRERVRQYGAISALDLLRRALDAQPG